jgi:hypothetical protein
MDRGGFFSLLSCNSISDAFLSARRDDDDSAGLSLFCNPKASDTMKGRKHFAEKRDFPIMELSLFSEDKTTSHIDSSVSESNNERKPITYDFLGVLENDHKVQVGEAEHDQSEEISLDLKVGYGYDYAPKKRKASETSANLPSTSRARGIKRRRLLNSHDGTVSLDLKLALDPWAIRKRIECSDIGHLARLLLAADCVKNHIFIRWDAKSIENVENKGVPVAVWDCDTESEHQLLFKKWSSGSYVLIKQWTREFVKRRELKKGDEIGLYWDPNNSRFSFSILKRALRD